MLKTAGKKESDSHGCAAFTLPHGSRVSYEVQGARWSPEWVGVAHDADLLPYRALMGAVQNLPQPLRPSTLEVAAELVGARLRRWTPPPAPTGFPAPLTPPSTPPFGSLTGYLRGTPQARQAIRTALRPSIQPDPAPLLCRPLGANPGLVGTAFDYAIRAVVQGRNAHLMPRRQMLVARLATLDLPRERTIRALDRAEATLAEVASGCPFEVRHARAAVVLASYEVVVRTGRYHELAGLTPKAAWQDVLQLARAVPAGAFQAERQLLPNPQFHAAARFGGADADLIVDDLLIEVKATRHMHLDGTYLQQLTGYLVLDRLAGTVHSTEPVRKLGVYYARHGVLQVMAVRDVYRPGMLPQLVSWFDQSLPQGSSGWSPAGSQSASRP